MSKYPTSWPVGLPMTTKGMEHLHPEDYIGSVVRAEIVGVDDSGRVYRSAYDPNLHPLFGIFSGNGLVTVTDGKLWWDVRPHDRWWEFDHCPRYLDMGDLQDPSYLHQTAVIIECWLGVKID